MPNSPPSFECSPFKPCKRILKLFRKPRIGLRRVIHKMRSSTRRRRRRRRRRFRSIRAAFLRLISRRTEEEADKIGEQPNLTERARPPLASPVTPAYVKMARHERDDEAEEACRSFENFLTEMLVDERKVRDLMDVEELLLCWSSLNDPVFVELVCRFYVELCNDLFSSDESGVAMDEIISAAT